MYYTASFEDNFSGEEVIRILDCPSLEDATTEAAEYADVKGLEFLSIDEIEN